MLSSRHIANETLAIGGPPGDIHAALHEFVPLATDNDIRDWMNTYDSEVWSSQEEKVRTITGDISLRCSVSTTACSAPLPMLNQAAQTIIADPEKPTEIWTYESAESIITDVEKSVGAWTYNWIAPTRDSPLAEHGAENWFQFGGMNIGCDKFIELREASY